MQNVGKYCGGEKILSPPWFQHCVGKCPRRSDASKFRDLCQIFGHDILGLGDDILLLSVAQSQDFQIENRPPIT